MTRRSGSLNRRALWPILMAGGSLLIASCSGEDGAANVTEASARPVITVSGRESTATPTTATTPTSAIPTTEPAPETSPSSTNTTATTAAPTRTTTTVPLDAETVIRATLEKSFSDFSSCLTSMPNCDPTVLEATRAGDLLAGNVARINEWNDAGYTVIDRDQYRYVIESVEFGEDETTATATVCLTDGSKLVQPGAGPDGADVIIDDTFVSGRDAWEMRLDDDGKWRAYAAPAVGPMERSDVCPAS